MQVQVWTFKSSKEKARDCYLMAENVSELKSSLDRAADHLANGQGERAKETLAGATDNAKALALLYPARAGQAKEILKRLGKVIKKVPKDTSKAAAIARLRHEIFSIEGRAQNLRAGAKVHCNVSLPLHGRKR